jgi:hypothetical protein
LCNVEEVQRDHDISWIVDGLIDVLSLNAARAALLRETAECSAPSDEVGDGVLASSPRSCRNSPEP